MKKPVIKICSKCKEIKSINEFHKNKRGKDGLQSRCKKCNKESNKNWGKNNPEKIRKINRKWKKNNSEYLKEYRKNNFKKNRQYSKKYREENPEKARENIKKFYKNNPEKYREIYIKSNKKRLSTPKGKLNQYISNGIGRSLKGNKNKNHWEDLVGYTLKDLMSHLESLFQSDINWNNYGMWHIDHIRPIVSFNFNSYEDKEFKQCWALNNLQPLWAGENLRKSSIWKGVDWKYGSTNYKYNKTY